ncbi:MAG: nucleotidyl transferase AbiEii/AbiGii toxin family protein [Nitrospirota bacterium]
MFVEVVPADLPRHLDTLSRAGVLGPFYLAGGTAVALQLGHRVSDDLDFFSADSFEADAVVHTLSGLGRLDGVEAAPGTVHARFEGTRLTFLHYPYPLLDPCVSGLGINLASLRDIGCMKIDAVASRGSRRDFVDLYTICTRSRPLDDLLRDFDVKFRRIAYNRAHILKSLCYFEDAEREPLPKLLAPLVWEDIKAFFLTESQRLARHWL